MKKDTVLFDFDGTVMDTNRIIMDSWQHTFVALTGREGDPEAILDTYGEPLYDTMRDFFGGTPEQVESNIDIYRSYQETIFKGEIRLFPGIRELFETLKGAGIHMAMVTSRLKASTLVGIETFGIGDYFDCIITADDCTAHKPDPQPVHRALERMGRSPEQTAMLGDTRLDLHCAHNAGVKALLVGWSVALRKELDTAVETGLADAVLRDPSDMLSVLDEL